MKAALVAAALVASAAASPMPYANPSGCESSHDGTFQITVVDASKPSKRGSMKVRQRLPSLELLLTLPKRQEAHVLKVSLKDGKLIDQDGRIGYISSSSQ